MRVLTTTLCYPTPEHPDQGIFVQRRAAALTQTPAEGSAVPDEPVDLRVVAPQPWCPLLRRGRRCGDQRHPLPAAYPRMLSVPVLNWAIDGLAYARTLRRYIAAHGRGRVDLLDAHFEYPDGVGAWLAGRRLHIPVVVTVRGKIVSLSRKTLRRLQIAAMLRGVDARIAVSESLLRWIHKVGGGDLRVDVIPNGVDARVFHLVDQPLARRLLGWDPPARYVLAVGHLQRLKGFDRLVEVMPYVRSAAGDVRLILAGSRRGEKRFRRQLQRQIEQCNARTGQAAPCVEFVGPVPSETLNLMYNAADLMTLASRSEGCSNALAEALAAGAPVVATDVGGNGEQICSPELGMIVPDGDQQALGEAIVSALDRPWNRVLISAHGGARRWDQVAREVKAVFVRVLKARHAWLAEPIAGPCSSRERSTSPAVQTVEAP